MLFSRDKLKRERSGICSVVVVAAGNSSRMGRDKILADLDGIPVIVHSLRTFQKLPEVGEIVIVTREDLIPEIASLCKEHRIAKVKAVVRGGESRLESSRIGTLETDRNTTLIAIHDGARPLVPEDVVRTTILRARETGAAAPAITVKDTIKTAEKGFAVGTVERSSLRAVQTPQVFDASLIRAALQSALDECADITDDCSAVERLGMRIALTEGSERNLKLTTPMDMMVAECILREGRVR